MRFSGEGDVPAASRLRRFAAMVGLAAALSLGLAACGGGDDEGDSGGDTSAATATAPAESQLDGLSADEVLTKMTAAAKAAGAVHAVADITSGGQNIKFDLTYSGDSAAQGTLSIGTNAFEIIRVGDDVFLKADAATYAQLVPAGGAEIGKLIGDKWLKGSIDDPQVGQIANFADFDGFIDGVLTPSGTLTRVDGKDVDGTPTVGLQSSSGGTMYVADSGEPYPLLLEPGADSDDQGSLRMTDWGKTVEITAPPADQTIDLSQIQG